MEKAGVKDIGMMQEEIKKEMPVSSNTVTPN